MPKRKRTLDTQPQLHCTPTSSSPYLFSSLCVFQIYQQTWCMTKLAQLQLRAAAVRFQKKEVPEGKTVTLQEVSTAYLTSFSLWNVVHWFLPARGGALTEYILEYGLLMLNLVFCTGVPQPQELTVIWHNYIDIDILWWLYDCYCY